MRIMVREVTVDELENSRAMVVEMLGNVHKLFTKVLRSTLYMGLILIMGITTFDMNYELVFFIRTITIIVIVLITFYLLLYLYTVYKYNRSLKVIQEMINFLEGE